jgi:hypothetical protein
MDIGLNRPAQISWPVPDFARRPRSIPLSHRSIRVLIVLALYGATVFAIHGLAAEFRTHATASTDTGMCHRH